MIAIVKKGESTMTTDATTTLDTPTTTLDTSTTDTAAKPTSRSKLPKVLTSPAEPTAASPIRTKRPITRFIAPGQQIDPNAVITVNVANPKVVGCRAHARFAKYQSGLTVAETFKIDGGPN